MKIIAVLLALCACSTPAILTPAAGPGTAWPCGYTWHSCNNGMCCPENYACGTENQGVHGGPFSGAPAGSCEYVGP